MTTEPAEFAESAEPVELLRTRAIEIAVANRLLVRALDFTVRTGERWCLLGPNGSGKTTLLHVLAGLRTAERGTVEICGRSYADWEAPAAARRRGLLPQGESYAFRASVEDCVLLGRHPHMGRFGWPSAHDREIVRDCMAVMDLAALGGRDVLSLSGGERQRCRIAAVLAQDPALLLLDEPTTHLDLRHQAALFRHLEKATARRGAAVIFSTHELDLAARFSTHAIVLHGDGRASVGTSAELLRASLLSEAFGFPIVAGSVAGEVRLAPRW